MEGFPTSQPDNTSPPPVASSFAILQTLPMQRIVEDRSWQTDPTSNPRSVMGCYSLHPIPESDSWKSLAPPSNSSSMALTCAQSQSMSNYSRSTPSLMSSYGTDSSHGSMSTSRRDSALDHCQAFLEERDDGNLYVPNRGIWPCSFWFLRCNEVLDSLVDYDAHAQTHFRGSIPMFLTCPFQCGWSVTAGSGSETWEQRWNHLSARHPEGGVVDKSSRPDPQLVQHLWRTRIISSVQEKDLRMYGIISDHVYLETENSSRQQRYQRRPGTGR